LRSSSKKQPAFDPSELEDLIFSPAVGNGVGSHLVGTVDEPGPPTVDTTAVTTVVTGLEIEPFEPNIISVKPDQSTVDMSDVTTVADMPTVVRAIPPTVAEALPTTVDRSPAKGKLWITDNGDLVPESRVRRIRLAQDVINAAEEAVYDTLWSARPVAAADGDRESSRVVQAGYDYLGKRTRLSKKTIQRVVARLMEKDFIAIERPADIYQRTSTMYRVFSYKTVLDRHMRKGRTHVVKLGPGFVYARPLDLTTVAGTNLSTVDDSARTTAVNPTTATVDKLDRSTVVPESIINIGQGSYESNSTSLLYAALAPYGAVDDDIVRRLWIACRQQAADCTSQEIVHFIEEKGRLVRGKDARIYSPLGFLLTSVPKCLAGESFRIYREQQARLRAAEAAEEARRQAELEAWRREQEERLRDPKVSEEDKRFIRECLGMSPPPMLD